MIVCSSLDTTYHIKNTLCDFHFHNTLYRVMWLFQKWVIFPFLEGAQGTGVQLSFVLCSAFCNVSNPSTCGPYCIIGNNKTKTKLFNSLNIALVAISFVSQKSKEYLSSSMWFWHDMYALLFKDKVCKDVASNLNLVFFSCTFTVKN